MKIIYFLLGLAVIINLFAFVDIPEKNIYTESVKGELTFTTSSECEMQEQEASSVVPLLIFRFIGILVFYVALTYEYRNVIEIVDITHKAFKNFKQYPRGCITTLA